MVDCSQKVALVLGGAGNVGSGVVGGFLKRGYKRVVAVSRDVKKLESLRNQLGADTDRFGFIVGDISTESGAEVVKNQVSCFDKVIDCRSGIMVIMLCELKLEKCGLTIFSPLMSLQQR